MRVAVVQISPNFRTAINVPRQLWDKFEKLVEKAMEQKNAADEAKKAVKAESTKKTESSAQNVD